MSIRVPRRVILQSTTIGIVGVAGCTMFESGSSQVPQLVDLNAINFDDEPHTVHVRLELDGETAYQQSQQLPAIDGEDDVKGAVFSDYPTKAESYVLSTWRDDRPEADARTLDFASFDTECLGVDVNIGSYGVDVEDPRLSIQYTTNCGIGTERS